MNLDHIIELAMCGKENNSNLVKGSLMRWRPANKENEGIQD